MVFFFISTPIALYGLALGGVVTALSSTAMVGTFNTLQRKELAGDVASHGLLPGLLCSFLLFGRKHMGWGALGAFISGVLSLICMRYIHRHHKISQDTALALTLSFFLGKGVFLLIYIQHHAGASQAGLLSFFLGDIASLLPEDIYLLYGLGGSTCLILWLLLRQLGWVCFDSLHAQAIGCRVKLMHTLLEVLTVTAVLVGAQTMGVLLIMSILVTPTTAARYWTKRLASLIFLGGFFAGFSGIVGALTSYYIKNMPMGAVTSLALLCILLFSILCAPKKGIWAQWNTKRKFKNKMLEENMLKLLFELGAQKERQAVLLPTLLSSRTLSRQKTLRHLFQLKRKGFVSMKDTSEGAVWYLTKKGKEIGEKIHKRHLLWEAFLQQKLYIQASHVHNDAESTEHLINPDIEALINKETTPTP